jgi:hypothetical protein
MQNIPHTRKIAAAFLVWLLCTPASFADAWHRFGKEDAFWHHGSGWIFPRQIGAFELLRSPYQIDGNDDVGAEYEMVVNGVRRTAFVDIYYPNSAAIWAKLDTARAAMQSRSKAGSAVRLKSEDKLAIAQRPEIMGVRTTYSSSSETGDAQLGLCFFRAANWVVTIRTSAPATDVEAVKALDAFVQAQRWDTLGTDSGRYL